MTDSRIAAGLIVLSLAAPVLLGSFGERQRTFGAAVPVGRQPVALDVILRPQQALAAWKARSFHGRTILYLDHRWPRVNADVLGNIPVARVYPLTLYNRAEMLEAEHLDSDTFLYVATQSGVARRLIVVLPEPALQELGARLRAGKHVERTGGVIFNAHMGLPRTFSMLRELSPPGEPVLLFVGAGFFRAHTPEDVLRRLQLVGVVTDHVALCLAEGDAAVGAAERTRLDAFARLLGAGR